MKCPCPAFGICGFSGSGKTAVIEAVALALTRRGLKVGVIKHAAHGMKIEPEGKDSDRFFKAGADVIVHGAGQVCLRTHGADDMALTELLWRIGRQCDLVLVEGHKTTPLPEQVWLSGEAGEPPPPGTPAMRRVLSRDEDPARIVLEMIDGWLPRAWRATPVHAGILIGGRSSRFGRPKHLEDVDGASWLEQTVERVRPHVDSVILLGAGEVPARLRALPVLCDAPDVEGPRRGMLAAMRWQPQCSWLFLPCDLPLLADEAVQWLLNQRAPGAWAVLPRFPDAPFPEPLLAYYDFRAAPLLERVRRPVDLAMAEHVAMPAIPQHLQDSWKNINTPDAWAKARTAPVGRGQPDRERSEE